MNRYWWSFVSNHREVACHAANSREDAITQKDRMKSADMVETGHATVDAAIRNATRDEIVKWCGKRFPNKVVTILT